MKPVELTSRVIPIPPAVQPSIVIITGGMLRHKRFALRIQEEFGNQVLAWFRVDSSAPSSVMGKIKNKSCALQGALAKFARSFRQPGIIKKSMDMVRWQVGLRRSWKQIARLEQKKSPSRCSPGKSSQLYFNAKAPYQARKPASGRSHQPSQAVMRWTPSPLES